MSRHQKSRRRTYGRRQHELRERPRPLETWALEAGADPDPLAPAFDALDAFDQRDEAAGLQLGHLFGRQGWRWAQGRG
jgi:hypothetical protein